MHKGEQKDRTKILAEFPDHILNDYDTRYSKYGGICRLTFVKLAQRGFKVCLGRSAGLLLQNPRVKNFTVSSLTKGFLLAQAVITSSCIAARLVLKEKRSGIVNNG